MAEVRNPDDLSLTENRISPFNERPGNGSRDVGPCSLGASLRAVSHAPVRHARAAGSSTLAALRAPLQCHGEISRYRIPVSARAVPRVTKSTAPGIRSACAYSFCGGLFRLSLTGPTWKSHIPWITAINSTDRRPEAREPYWCSWVGLGMSAANRELEK
jgi:hypothetical protein